MDGLNGVLQEAFSGDLEHLLLPVTQSIPAINTIGQHAYANPPMGVFLFTEIAQHIISQRQRIATLKRQHNDAVVEEGPLKRRKLDIAQQNGTAAPAVQLTTNSLPAAAIAASATPSFSARDISFSLPQRKKFTLELVPDVAGAGGGIRGVNPATGETEFSLGWNQIDEIISVPVPEKAQPQVNFVVIPHAPLDAILWTLPVAPFKPGTCTPDPSLSADALAPALLTTLLTAHLGPYHKTPLAPAPDIFKSAIPQPHRPGEAAFHVRAHRGAKDGFLFFLRGGILFGFRKPVLWVPLARVARVVFAGVVRRTFDLVVGIAGGAEGAVEDVEFAMLDQAEFAGVQEYVRIMGLDDASLAKERQAKVFNVNRDSTAKRDAGVVVDGEAGAQQPGQEEEESELAKAERLLQDAEDEEEEDFDPGSEGESEGSGTSDEEGDDGGGRELDEDEVEGDDEDEVEDVEGVEEHGPGDGCAGHGEEMFSGRDGYMFGYKLDKT